LRLRQRHRERGRSKDERYLKVPVEQSKRARVDYEALNRDIEKQWLVAWRYVPNPVEAEHLYYSILLSQNVKSVSVFFFQWSCGLLGFL